MPNVGPVRNIELRFVVVFPQNEMEGSALEFEFIDENGGGPGVRLRKRQRQKPRK